MGTDADACVGPAILLRSTKVVEKSESVSRQPARAREADAVGNGYGKGMK